jgi:hypothetical protein
VVGTPSEFIKEVSEITSEDAAAGSSDDNEADSSNEDEIDSSDDDESLEMIQPRSGVDARLALAQVNHQSRAEYRPLLMAKTEFSVPARGLDQFIDTFLPVFTDISREEIAKYNTNGSNVVSRDAAATFNIHPLMYVLREAPGVVAKFKPNKWDTWYVPEVQKQFIKDLNKLLRYMCKLKSPALTLYTILQTPMLPKAVHPPRCQDPSSCPQSGREGGAL